MKKLLTELHLLMERIDFQYVATELVKNYNLKSKVKFGTFGKDKGGYNWDDDVLFFDDSRKNIEAVKKLEKQYPDIKMITRLVNYD